MRTNDLGRSLGEIDHKYRYELARQGGPVAEHVRQGFYSFAAYLQAAALQAEYLCAEAESVSERNDAAQLRIDGQQESRPAQAAMLRPIIERLFGFQPSARTLSYIGRRLLAFGVNASNVDRLETTLLTPEVVQEFQEAYGTFYTLPPFTDLWRRNVDLINVINFALLRSSRDPESALAGLRSVLERRLKAETEYDVVVDEEPFGPFRFPETLTIGEIVMVRGVQAKVVSLEAGDGMLQAVCERHE